MPQRKGRCKVQVGKQGKRPISCGMPLNANGECPEHGKQK
jgi:hypothetical protein